MATQADLSWSQGEKGHWMRYRIVLAGKATWFELERMSLDDVQLLSLAMDAWEDAVRIP